MSWTRGRPRPSKGAKAVRRRVLAEQGGMCACDGCAACAGWGRTDRDYVDAGLSDQTDRLLGGARARALAVDSEAMLSDRVEAMRAGQLTRQEASMLEEGVEQRGACMRVATDDDHVIGVANGLEIGLSIQEIDHPANHRGLCHECHDEKTKVERREGQMRRVKRMRNDEDHPGIKK